MKIAVPIWQDRVSPLLDAATRLLVVNCRNGKDASRRIILLSPLPPEAMARSVAELRVDLLLCGAVSAPLLSALRKLGVRVRRHLCGDVEDVLHAWCHHQLARKEFCLPGCWRRYYPRATSKQGRTSKRRCAARTSSAL